LTVRSPGGIEIWTRAFGVPRIGNAMAAVIGNVLAGLLAAGLFTATVRISK
jgi:hypothetical protein